MQSVQSCTIQLHSRSRSFTLSRETTTSSPAVEIEVDEVHCAAIKREVLEETGCKVSVDNTAFFAQSEEWRNDLHQISFCYSARLVEDTGRPELTDVESSEGLSHS